MIAELLAVHLRGFRANDIMDVGPGFSDFACTAARLSGASHCCFVDRDPEVLASQARSAAAAGLQARCVQVLLTPATAAALPGQYDLILCQEVLEHLEEAEAVARALAAKLRPGGRMVITVPTRFSERWLRLLNPGYMRDVAFGHVRQFDRRALDALARAAGLRVVACTSTQPHYFLFHTWLFGARIRCEAATGRILGSGWRVSVAGTLLRRSRRWFAATGCGFWGRVFPRVFFLVGERPAAMRALTDAAVSH